MKDEKGITLIALLLVIIITIGGILAFKIIFDKKSNEINTSSTPTISSNTNNNSATIGLRKEFKEAMDSYETVMDEYIIFMKKYSDSKGRDPQLISAYGEYMKKYIDATDAFKKWNGKEMNKEEAKYYIDVQTRVTQKLMNASIDMTYN